MRTSLFMKTGMTVIAASCLAVCSLAWLTSPAVWWMNPDLERLAAQLQTCESPFAARQTCDTAKVMTRQALDALRACLGDQAEVDGCDTVRLTAARQAESLQRLVHSASVEPATRVPVFLGLAFNPWLRAARSGDWLVGSPWPWVLLVLFVGGLIGWRVGKVRGDWQAQENQKGALRHDLDLLEQQERTLERLVNWMNALQSQLRAVQRRRYANLLPAADDGASSGPSVSPDLQSRLDRTFGAQPSAAQDGLTAKGMADEAAWRELGSGTRQVALLGVRRVLHLPTGLLLRFTCHRTEELGGDAGFWEFAVRLDGIEAGLPHRRPVELSADFLQSDWLASVPHEKIAVNDWPAALVAGKDWLEAVLQGERPVEGGTLSTQVERRLRDQLNGVRREKARKHTALRMLHADMACGWHRWCWQRLLRRRPLVSDAAFHVHDGDG